MLAAILTANLHLAGDKRTSPFRISDGCRPRVTVWLGARKQSSLRYAAPMALTQFAFELTSGDSDESDGRRRIFSKLDFAARTTRLILIRKVKT